MKKIWLMGVVLWSLASLAGAGTIRNWSDLQVDKNAGVYSDKDGSKVEIAMAPGPQEGEQALRITAHLVGWGGAWALAKGNLSGAGAVHFKAKSSKPLALNFGLVDKKKVGYDVNVRVLSEEWREFVIPLSLFQRSSYQAEGLPKKGAIDWSSIASMTISPAAQGDYVLFIGSITSGTGKSGAQTGMKVEKGTLVVQDFTLLEKNAYGPFSDDKGTSITLSLKKDPEGDGAKLADFHYELKKEGWCGYWMRTGDSWGGQDWSGAESMTLEVYSEEPIQLNIGFNDPNQCSYVAEAPGTNGKGWETVTIPFKDFVLNKYYQPEGAKKGAPLDLSRVEAVNLNPRTEGKHEFLVRGITLRK